MTREAFKLFSNEIKAFQEGKQIQIFIRNKWVDTDNPSFDVKSKYRVKPEEQKTIVEKSIDGVTWYEIGKITTELNDKMKFARIRVIGEEKPKPTKRLPTIEEVEKWFLENRVFVYKNTNVLQRIDCFDKNNENSQPVFVGGLWKGLEKFCADYINLDGSELYITENEKLTYGGEIADFPIEVVERMLECQVEQGNKRDVSVFEKYSARNNTKGGFDWHSTTEGRDFWVSVICGKQFDLFFQKYHKKQ